MKWFATRRSKIIAALVGLPVLYVGAVGFAHTPKGRPLLPYLGMGGAVTGGCPVDKYATPELMEKHRIEAMDKLRGEGHAASVDALGFKLGQTTRDELDAWAAKRKVECKGKPKDLAVDCQNVPATAFEPALGAGFDSIFLRFDTQSPPRLVAIDAQYRDSTKTAAEAVRGFETLASTLSRSLGAPTTSRGGRTAEYFTEGPFRRGDIEYRFDDLAVDLSMMSMPEERVLLRAQFRSIPKVVASADPT